MYRATVLAVLLYGAETWTVKAEHTRHLTTFHNRCVRTILGVKGVDKGGGGGLGGLQPPPPTFLKQSCLQYTRALTLPAYNFIIPNK